MLTSIEHPTDVRRRSSARANDILFSERQKHRSLVSYTTYAAQGRAPALEEAGDSLPEDG